MNLRIMIKPTSLSEERLVVLVTQLTTRKLF